MFITQRVCMQKQIVKKGLIPVGGVSRFGKFAAAKQTTLPNHGQRYTFSRTADTGHSTVVRIKLVYYIYVQGFLGHPEKNWKEALAVLVESPPDINEAEK